MELHHSKTEYIEYLLKNFKSIENDLKQMKIELEHYEVEKPEETIEAMSLYSKGGEKIGSGCSICDDTARVAMIYRSVNERINSENKERLKKQIASGEIELKKLRTAIDGLPEDMKNVIEDLYIRRLKWDQIAMRRYISNNTINRYRKKGIEEIARGFFIMETVA